ncbi:coproporphyrinogen III oxidase [Rhodobacterales bacterium LSUCC0387]|nr:coproporphyrinogen III oxidase [Rhodobacterales bacterium LSUCC0387]
MNKRDDWENGGFGIYIHWPFCQAKCPYCDFNSHVSQSIDQSRWKRAYLSEIDRLAAECGGRVLTSVFFGGGTPSLMDGDLVNAIIAQILQHWPAANDLEITLEANPTSTEAGRFKQYHEAGVSRLSMGIQALKDPDLKALGRLHSAEEALRAFDIARGIFSRVSFDLIYARQHQSLDDWRAELSHALSLGLDHLSAYQLTIEEGTAFGARAKIGKLDGLPNEDMAVDMYNVTQELCDIAGLPAYEVSNHASDLAQSRHNLVYWRYGDYLGIGPGAHGRLTLNGVKYATATPLLPNLWLDQVNQTGSGETAREEVSPYDQAVEALMMGLRLSEGVSLARIRNLSNTAINLKKLREFKNLGLISLSGDRLSCTASGRPVLNGVLRGLLA